MRTWWTVVGLLVAGSVVAVSGCEPGDASRSTPGCGGGEVVEGRPLRVVVTVAPLTDIVSTIAAGSGAEIGGVVPEGADSHTFEPSPSDAAALERADVVFLNGLGLEVSIRRLATSNLADGAEICELGTTVLPESEYRFDSSFPESGGAPNPHLWTSPRWADEYAVLIASVLSGRDPGNAGLYAANLVEFRRRLDDLDRTVRAAMATVPVERRLLLTYHDAYAYFAVEYGWRVVGAVQPASFGEPSPREVARLIDQVDQLGVRAIFGSEVFPSPVLEQIAAATGAVYVADLRDDDLPGAPGDPEHSWFGMMRSNTAAMVEALGGDAAGLRGE